MSILEAIAAGDAERARAVLADAPEQARARDGNGVSALMLALYRGRDDIAAMLHAGRDDVDVFEAAALGDRPRLEALLAADPGLARAWSADGFTALHFAAFFGQAAAAERLIAAGAEVGATARNPMRVQPLHSAAAARRERAAVARHLLAAGADPNARQHAGWTPIHAAAQHGDLALVDLLLAHGADPALAADDGRDAFALARDDATRARLGPAPSGRG